MNSFDNIQCEELNRDWIDELIEDNSEDNPEDWKDIVEYDDYA
jgi:hypothetical protein